MARTVTIPVVAPKGRAHRDLRAAIDVGRAALEGEADLPPALLRVLDAAHQGANKLISAAGCGDQIHLQIHLQETPFGGWEVSLLAEVPTPTTAGG